MRRARTKPLQGRARSVPPTRQPRPNGSIYQVVDRAVKRPNNGEDRFPAREGGPPLRPLELSLAGTYLEGNLRFKEITGSMMPAPLDHDALRSALEAAGLRCTPQRLAVYDQLSGGSHHPTAEELFQAVRTQIPKISLATVYKALEALLAIGAATRLTAGDGAGSARYDARNDQHYHFRCLRTDTVHDLPTRFDPELISKLDPTLAEDLRRQGFRVTGYRLELLGYLDQDRDPPSRPAVQGIAGPASGPQPADRTEA